MRPVRVGDVRVITTVSTFGLLVLLLGGCGGLSGAMRTQSSLLASQPVPAAAAGLPETPGGHAPVAVNGAGELARDEPGFPSTARAAIVADHRTGGAADGDEGAEPLLAQTQRAPQEKITTKDEEEAEEYDPWEKFNETMFDFNRKLDTYILKPVAKAYNVIMPQPFQVLIANGFDNIGFVPRAVNSLLQAKWGGAGREVSRFLINSTLGIGGLFDAAKYWGIEKSREDFGQTLAVWGAGPGPYLILPFLEPLTVRDGIGKGVDGAMNPLSYFLPFLWAGVGMKAGDTVNDRALNLDLFQGFEESVIDMYSAVRNAYLRRREQLIKQ